LRLEDYHFALRIETGIAPRVLQQQEGEQRNTIVMNHTLGPARIKPAVTYLLGTSIGLWFNIRTGGNNV
jgi:hypothetical protein